MQLLLLGGGWRQWWWWRWRPNSFAQLAGTLPCGRACLAAWSRPSAPGRRGWMDAHAAVGGLPCIAGGIGRHAAACAAPATALRLFPSLQPAGWARTRKREYAVCANG